MNDIRLLHMSSPRPLRQLKQALEDHRKSLEALESALLEFEEGLHGESQERPQTRVGLDLLSIPEVCQELRMGKSWVYRRIQNGEVPSVKLGRSIKIKREALEAYLESQRFNPMGEELAPPSTETH